jgi:hypothetical protein
VPDLKGAFQTASKMSAAGLTVISNPLTVSFRKQIVELANVNRLPAMYPVGSWADEGGVMAYGIGKRSLPPRSDLRRQNFERR